MEIKTERFETEQDIGVYLLEKAFSSARWLEWSFLDRGPGIFFVPETHEMGIRAEGMNDDSFRRLVDEMEPISALRYLHLAENRGITNRGVAQLARLPQLWYLNISSCDVNNDGMAFLGSLPELRWLDLSYCNRISEKTAKFTQKLNKLTYLNLQGVLKVNKAGLKKFERRGLEIYSG